MGTIFALSLCCTLELVSSGGGGKLIHMSGAQVFMSGAPVLVVAAQGKPLDGPALMTR